MATTLERAREFGTSLGLAKSTLDLALTLKIIKTDFESVESCPCNSDIFLDSYFIEAEICGERKSAIALHKNLGVAGQRRVVDSIGGIAGEILDIVGWDTLYSWVKYLI
ncbi:hypothetical protein Trydic_g20847 [Trypoxylus dichotomus]